MNKYIKTTKISRKTRSIKAIKFKRFQRKLVNTLSYATTGPQDFLAFINHIGR